MDFLGYRLFPGTVRLARRSKVRFTRKFRRYEAALMRGDWSELVLQQRMQALLAFVVPANSGAFRQHVLQRFRVAAKRLEPRESGRQLEQQREQLPDGEPQQQQPDEPEQQHWVPLRPSRSSIRTPESARTDPAAILSPARVPPGQRPTHKPPGASKLVDTGENSGRFGSCARARSGARAMERGHSCPPSVAWRPPVAKRASGHRDGTGAIVGASAREADKNVRAPANGGACNGARTFLSAECGTASASAIRASGHRDGTCAFVGASAREADKNVRAPLREMIYEPANL
jgi:hypothetical protein